MGVKQVLASGLVGAVSLGVGGEVMAKSHDDNNVNPQTGIGKHVKYDKDWRLTKVRGVGATDVHKGSYGSAASKYESAYLRLDFRIGDIALSCLAEAPYDGRERNAPRIMPEFCFIEGDPSQPVFGSNNVAAHKATK